MQANKGITLLGLGPGSKTALTREAWEILQTSEEIYLRTRNHPVVAEIQSHMVLHSFDFLYEERDTFEEVYAEITSQVLQLGQRSQGVIYAVPGHPLIAEATGQEILRRAREAKIPVRVIQGLSFLEPVMTALGSDPFPQMTLADALELAAGHYPPFPPSAPILIAQLYSRAVASDVKLTLMAVYPDDFPVRLVHRAGTDTELVEDLPLYAVDHSEQIGLLTCLYLPPLSPAASMEAFAEIVAHLRAPDGCPWDQKQTLQSLRPHLLEEAYEVLDTLDNENTTDLREELGDLLLMIFMLTQIASDEGEFNLTQVVEGIHTKIVRRHPHVFGDVELSDEAGVLAQWEKLKAAEREANGASKPDGLLDGVSAALPALAQALEIQERASRVGFDWQEARQVLAKITEELDELNQAETPQKQSAEFGDLLFALVNYARHLEIDAETALRAANRRFRQRFQFIEQAARREQRSLAEMSLAEMDALWEKAKEQE